MYICVKFLSANLNYDPYPHIPQTLILEVNQLLNLESNHFEASKLLNLESNHLELYNSINIFL